MVVPYIMEDIRLGKVDLAPAIRQLLPSENTPSSGSVKAWKKWVSDAGTKYVALKGNAGEE
ncbi:hypothetical protein D3C84_1238610 [compost metagenome]